MNVRLVPATRQPLKVLVDSRLDADPQARLFDGGEVLVACSADDAERAARLRERGAEVIVLPNGQGKVDLAALLKELARRGINEVHAEAGFKLNGSLVREGCVDELLVYLAPMLIGPGRGLAAVELPCALPEAPRWSWVEVSRVGADLRLRLRPPGDRQ
jgi:diaminohydroxyphosphoribosylaminopyrimidine deaminase/5-amino-6-(5-phosphoribosylamino)uracil reductase